MRIVEKIYNEEKYRTDVRRYFDSILDGRLLNIKPEGLSHDKLLSLITDYDINKLRFDNFCTWMEIGASQKLEYNGKSYDVINLIAADNRCLSLNYSLFRFPMSPYEGSGVFQPEKAKYISTIDFESVDPAIYFAQHKGEKLLHIYNLECVNRYDSNQYCYYFAYSKTSESYLREYFIMAQMNMLKFILLNPDRNAPSTTISVQLEGVPNSQPQLSYNTKCDMTTKIVYEIFNSEYRSKFEDLLANLLGLNNS